MTVKWDGMTKLGLSDSEVELRHHLANAAKAYDWKKTLEILMARPDLINMTRPDGHSLYTPLHQAAHGDAPVQVVKKMILMGGWRTLRNADGETAADIARRKSHQRLIKLLDPAYKIYVPQETLASIQKHFHAIIRNRASDVIEQFSLRLPELEPLIEIEKPQMWFTVPGMYGGFHYWLDGEGENVKLISESWCRVVGGSGQRHEITSREGKLTDEGFV